MQLDAHEVRFFFFQAEDGIRDYKVTGVQTCALPISRSIALTETGREFYDEFKGIVRDVGSAFDNAMHSGNRIAGRLRISTTSEYGEKYILPLIPAFLERYPGISVADRKSTRLNSSHLVISY